MAQARTRPGWLTAVLRVPLAAKLVGANAVVVAAAITAAAATHDGGAGQQRMLMILALALAASLVVNLGLVLLALRPVRDLEVTAARIWRGDLAARVPPSPLADRDMARVGETLNLVLDGLVNDRARLRQLAAEVIRAGDTERAHIARELHDSSAQTLAAVKFQLAALARRSDPPLADDVAALQELVGGVLEEVRLLSYMTYPRVLDDRGLPAALDALARRVEEHDSLAVTVAADAALQPRGAVPAPVASVLYRVAQESIGNAARHARARELTVTLRRLPGTVALTVADDGVGFDVAGAEARRPGMGLFTMRERVGLVDGRLTVESRPGGGTRVTATVLLATAPPNDNGRSAPLPITPPLHEAAT